MKKNELTRVIVLAAAAAFFAIQSDAEAAEDFVDCSSWYFNEASMCRRVPCEGELLDRVGAWEGKFEFYENGRSVPVIRRELYSSSTCFDEPRTGDHFIVGLLERNFTAEKNRAAHVENGLLIAGTNPKTKQSFYREVSLKDGTREFIQVGAKDTAVGKENSWKSAKGPGLSETVDQNAQKRSLVFREKDMGKEKIVSKGTLVKLPNGRISHFSGRIWVMRADGRAATQGEILKKNTHDPVGNTVADKGFFVEEGKGGSKVHFWEESRSDAKLTPGLAETVRESTQEINGKRKIKTIEVLQLDGTLHASRQLLDSNGVVISSAVETGRSIPKGEFESKFRKLLEKCDDCGDPTLPMILH